MESGNKIDTVPGNTPVRNVPSDYFPKGDSYWFILPDGRDAGKKLFFRDSTCGPGEPEDTFVFVHGNPESSYTYRKVINSITLCAKKPVRIIAMDHIGFGLSDQASYEMVCMDHADNLLQLIRHLDLRNVTLVIHDWGGPIGTGAFLKEPERVSNLVILNSTVFPMPDKGYTYNNYPISWLGWSKLPEIIFDRWWGAFAAYAISRPPAKPGILIIHFVIFLAMSEMGIIPKHERTARLFYREQFNSKKNVRSSKRLVKQSAVWGHGNKFIDPNRGERDTEPFYKFIQDNIGQLWGPEGQNIGTKACLGQWDPLAKESIVAQWINALPQLKDHVKTFDGVGHFVEEARFDEIADAIIDVAGIN